MTLKIAKLLFLIGTLYEKLEQPKENAIGPTPAPPATEAKITPEVKQRWDNYHAAMFEIISKKNVPEKLHACYGRFHEKAIKIAMLLAVSDWVRMAKGNPLIIYVHIICNLCLYNYNNASVQTSTTIDMIS